MQWGSDKPENLGKYANSAYDTLLSVIAGAERGRPGWVASTMRRPCC